MPLADIPADRRMRARADTQADAAMPAQAMGGRATVDITAEAGIYLGLGGYGGYPYYGAYGYAPGYSYDPGYAYDPGYSYGPNYGYGQAAPAPPCAYGSPDPNCYSNQQQNYNPNQLGGTRRPAAETTTPNQQQYPPQQQYAQPQQYYGR